jgi:hypothetical protein
MFKKIVIVGGASLAILGIGTAAFASAPAATGSPTAATAAPAAHKFHARHGHAETRAIHGQWVTQHGTKLITHDEIRGAVTAVSSTSISVKAADGVTEKYVVGAGVKVHLKADGKGTAGTISQVKVGDHVAVTGTGTGPLTARRVLDRGAGTTK